MLSIWKVHTSETVNSIEGGIMGIQLNLLQDKAAEGWVCLRLVCRAWLRADTIVLLSRG